MWPCHHDLLILLWGVNFCELICVLWVTSGLWSKWLRDRRKPAKESTFCSIVLYIDGWISDIWWQPEPARSKEQCKGWIWVWHGQRGLCDTVTCIRRAEETEDQAGGSLRSYWLWGPQPCIIMYKEGPGVRVGIGKVGSWWVKTEIKTGHFFLNKIRTFMRQGDSEIILSML